MLMDVSEEYVVSVFRIEDIRNIEGEPASETSA
jgi:hypothetical protein